MELVGTSANIRRAVAAAGAASLLAQVVLLREILAFSQGNEIVLGIVLGVWLCLTGAATALGARPSWQEARAAVALYLLLSSAPFFYLGALGLTTLARPDVLGEAAALPWTLVTSVVALGPACAVGGLAFAWATKASAPKDQAAIYVAETAGAAVAGLLFHFLLGERLHGVWILLVAGACCATAAVGVVWSRLRWRALWLPLAAVLVAGSLGPKVASAVDGAYFPGERVLSLRPSRYGLLAVLARGEQRVFLQDGVLLFTSEDQISAEETVHLPMLLHPAPRRLLFLGGGLGGGLVEALKHGPERVDYAEVDPGLLGLAAEYGAAETRAALSDSRVHVAVADGRALLRQAKQQYDLIFIQAPVPQNALLARYSTRECFEDARRALAPGGILALATPGSDTHLGEAARQRHSAMVATLTKVFPFVGFAPGAETILWASNHLVDARATVLAARLKQRGLQTVQVGPTWLFDRLLPMHVASYQHAVAAALPVESRDFRPVVYLFGLLETLQRLSPTLAKRLLGLVFNSSAWIAAAGIIGLVFLLWSVRRRRPAPGLAVAAAGAAGMSLQLVLLIAYQSLRGHLYYALGLLLAGSMAGMAIGAWGAGRLSRQNCPLVPALAAVACVAIVIAGLLAIAPAVPGAASLAMVPLLFLVGAATGAVYPVAVQASARAGAGARMYAWDLVGAAVAAFFTSLFAIPLLGLVPVTLLGAALCSVAAVANFAKP
jgi:spermidine synthase